MQTQTSRDAGVPAARQPPRRVTGPDFPWEFGFVSRRLPPSPDCSASLPPQPVAVCTDGPAPHFTHPFLSAHHPPEQSASPRHSPPPPRQPHEARDRPLQFMGEELGHRETRQQARVAQLSERRDQGQVQLLTPKPVLSSAPPHPTLPRPLVLNTHCAVKPPEMLLKTGLPQKMLIQLVGIRTQVSLLFKAPGDF